MRLLVGLGNPGKEYEKTRHNAGFYCLDKVAEALGAGKPKKFKDGELYEMTVEGHKILLFKPLQYMNRSGLSLRAVTDYFSLPVDHLCIAYDDVYIAPGSVRVRKGGGDGGHNGVKSVLEHLQPDSFYRVRIGVGLYEQHPEKRVHQPALDDYVQQPLPKHERHQMESIIDIMVPNLIEWLKSGELVEHTIHL